MRIPDEMGQSDLVLLDGKALLAAIAIGDPEVGPIIRQEIAQHALGPGWIDNAHGAVLMMDHPEPRVVFADPQASFIGFEHGTR